MKKSLLLIPLLFFAFMTACSSNDVTPNEQFSVFTPEWNEENFGKMYEVVSSDSQQDFPKEKFVDRYEKIYEDLAISELNITFYELSDDDIKKANKNETVELKFKDEMTSVT